MVANAKFFVFHLAINFEQNEVKKEEKKNQTICIFVRMNLMQKEMTNNEEEEERKHTKETK